MRFPRLPRVTREDVSETVWKWRCKISAALKRSDRTLADYSSGSSFFSEPEDGINERNGGGPGTRRAGKSAGSGEDGKDSGFGATPAVKTLYERRNSSDSTIDWVEYPPKQVPKSAAKAQDRVAIKVYKARDPEKPVLAGRIALKVTSIDVQNPLLVAALVPILKKEDWHLDPNETAKFKEPFRPLYFCYDDIVAKYKTLAEADPLKQHMLLLTKVLDEIFGELRTRRRALVASGLVSYKLAWTYFPKDCEVISWGHNCELLMRVVTTMVLWSPKLAKEVFSIRGKVLRFDGESFIWEDTILEIEKFEGNKPIIELPHYPLAFHSDGEDVKRRLEERGKKMLDYQGLTYCSYTGIGIYKDDKEVQKHNVDGRILVDVVGYNKHHLARGIREGHDPETNRNRVGGTGRPSPADQRNRKTLEKALAAKRLDEKEIQKNIEVMLEREQELAFIGPMVQGYALKNKLWMSFFLEDLKPMVLNDQAFDHLVYDEQQKDLVLSFVENHNEAGGEPGMGDVIIGKGAGLIILLSGPPGTGKTLTAEAVADRTKRPLFYLQAEDLGINAALLGANLKRIFEMATEWNAVILLDEADVFMAERNPHDIARNELVSIFLRELEYFRGIIFLTTNLYQTIDSAFRSRVNLHLLFKPLTADARERVWRKFFSRLPGMKNEVEAVEDGGRRDEGSSEEKVQAGQASTAENGLDDTEAVTGQKAGSPRAPIIDITDEDLKELAAWTLNGREIKNAVKMVKSWCDHKGYDLTLERLENGIRATSPHAAKHIRENDTSLYDLYE